MTTLGQRTDDELRASIADGEAAQRELARRRYRNHRAIEVEERVRRALLGDPAAAFDASKLHFAAYARCECGAGMAYPDGTGVRGAWHCSAVLRGTASREVAHSAALPFAFYAVKSEDQPSANGATTRGER